MFHAPSAIINHLNILPSYSEEMESDIICKSVPLIFTSENNYSKSNESFLESIKAHGWNNELHDECKSVCGRLGEFNFCEAVKVDLAASKEKSYQKSLQSTASLITVLFQDFATTMDIHNKHVEEAVNVYKSKPQEILFNKGLTTAGLVFGEGIILDYHGVEKGSLKLLESLCVFGYRKFYKTILSLIVEFNKRMVEGETTFCKNSVFVLN